MELPRPSAQTWEANNPEGETDREELRVPESEDMDETLLQLEAVSQVYLALEGDPGFEQWRESRLAEMLAQNPHLQEKLDAYREAFLAYANNRGTGSVN